MQRAKTFLVLPKSKDNSKRELAGILKKAGVKSFSSDMTIIKLPETPGELAKIARVLTSLRIEVRDAHLILKSHGFAIYGVTTDKPAETRRIVDNFLSPTEKEGKD